MVMNKKKMLATLLLSLSAVLLTMAAPATTAYEAYYLYLGNYPNEANPGWHVNVQGLTHDSDNWFITQETDLWKIPVTHDLRSVSANDPGVRRLRLGSITELATEGYDHFGDPTYYAFGGSGYLLAPMEGGPHPAIAIFRASDLGYVDHAYLPEQSQAGWCAVDPQGNAYSSNGEITSINKYGVSWDTLHNTRMLLLTSPASISLLSETGASVTIERMQGGEISPGGELLYLVAGYLDANRPSDGIHVFDLSTRRRIQRSTNGSGHFNYEFNPGGLTQEEPEGLTIWDLDADGRAPGIKGQLHVLLLDNDAPDTDDVYMKHYTGTIYVDRNYTGEEKGTPSKPFNTVAEANNLAWDRAQIKIRAGSYPETLTFSKMVKILSEGGTATVGR
jgi:hypothetical protein